MAAIPLPRPESRRRSQRLWLVLLVITLLIGAWGLAKIDVLPIQAAVAKNPAVRRVLTALGLGAKQEAVASVAPAVLPPAPLPLQDYDEPAEMPAPRTPRPKRKDNTGHVARILATMDASEVARLFAVMPDAEVAPLLLKMSERTAGEILTALPTRRAIALTRYLRHYWQGG